MKLIIIFFSILILPAFLLGQEKGEEPDTVVVEPDTTSSTIYLPLILPLTQAQEGDLLLFKAPKSHGLTYIIPKADTLFADDMASIGIIIRRTKFLIISLEAGQSRLLKIDDEANQGVGKNGKRYFFAVYDKGIWGEGKSSPVIIIKPGS